MKWRSFIELYIHTYIYIYHTYIIDISKIFQRNLPYFNDDATIPPTSACLGIVKPKAQVFHRGICRGHQVKTWRRLAEHLSEWLPKKHPKALDISRYFQIFPDKTFFICFYQFFSFFQIISPAFPSMFHGHPWPFWSPVLRCSAQQPWPNSSRKGRSFSMRPNSSEDILRPKTWRTKRVNYHKQCKTHLVFKKSFTLW